MPIYTVQRFDRRSRPLKPRYIVCSDDDDALEAAARIRHNGRFILTAGERAVWTFEDRRENDRK